MRIEAKRERLVAQIDRARANYRQGGHVEKERLHGTDTTFKAETEHDAVNMGIALPIEEGIEEIEKEIEEVRIRAIIR